MTKEIKHRDTETQRRQLGWKRRVIGPVQLLSLCLCATAGCSPRVAPLKELDCSQKDGKFLESHFTRYPQKPKTVFRHANLSGVSFFLTPDNVGVGQTTLYSNFVVAGDFEISMTYEGFNVPAPETGYGISCGLAVDTENKDGTPGMRVHFTRSSLVRKKDADGYAVVVGRLKKQERGIDYKLEKFEPNPAPKGKIALKRVRDTLSCLQGDPDTPIAELSEIAKLKFTDSTIKKVRIFADQGGSPTLLDVYIDNMLIKAEEITFQIPARDRPRWFWWIIAGITFVLAGATAIILHRRRSARMANP
jgi:hypothetical protein